MPENSEVKKWLVRVSAGVATTLVIFGLIAAEAHFSRAEETEERSLENKQRNIEQDAELKPIRELVEKLGNRAAAEDAALERDAELCRQGVITDKMICGAAGEEVVQ